MSRQQAAMKRFSAMLLFQCRVVTHGKSDKRRRCHKLMIHYLAGNARAALAHAKKRGREAEFYCSGGKGLCPVYYEFVGVLDLLCLEPVFEPDVVWHDGMTMLTPTERRKHIIPPESQLRAILNKE